MDWRRVNNRFYPDVTPRTPTAGEGRVPAELTGVSRVIQGWWGGLHAIAGRQPLLQQRGELLGELLPVLLSHLVLEAM